MHHNRIVPNDYDSPRRMNKLLSLSKSSSSLLSPKIATTASQYSSSFWTRHGCHRFFCSNNNHHNNNNNIESNHNSSKDEKQQQQQRQRPFRMLGVQQIAIGSEKQQPLRYLWNDIFGLRPTHTKTIETENVTEDIISLGFGPSPLFNVEIDLMTPLDPSRSPKVHQPPLNHIGLWVDQLEQAVEWMTQRGVRFTPGGIRVGAAGHNVIFIHPVATPEYPVSGNGVLIELVQAPAEIINAYHENK